jgi:hypothetical protein
VIVTEEPRKTTIAGKPTVIKILDNIPNPTQKDFIYKPGKPLPSQSDPLVPPSVAVTSL